VIVLWLRHRVWESAGNLLSFLRCSEVAFFCSAPWTLDPHVISCVPVHIYWTVGIGSSSPVCILLAAPVDFGFGLSLVYADHSALLYIYSFYPGQFELTVLVPKPRFIARDDADQSSALATTPESDDLELYNSLSLPVTKLDSLHELKQMVVESADGYWLGAVGFRRVLLKIIEGDSEGESRLEFSGEASDVLGEYSELSHVFDGPEYEDDKVLRVLKVVESLWHQGLLPLSETETDLDHSL
jgi:hypothetical protein